MSEVQGTLEFSIELHKFHNVDLFQRGFYQVRTGLKVSPRVLHRLLVTTQENAGRECSFSSPGVYDGTVFSRIFQILYRNEDITVNDCMIFKVHLLLDGERLEEALSEVDFQLKLDLHFTDNEQQLTDIASVPLISSRTLNLHFHPQRGLHHHVPVMFDYFHLSVISVSIHASLVALHQPLISFARTGKASWLGKGSPEGTSDPAAISVENLVFGAGYCKPIISEGSFYVPSEDCLQRAHTWHRRLCRLLLSARGGLSSYCTALLKEVPQLQHIQADTALPVEEMLNQLAIELQLQEGHEKVAEQISSDVGHLCAQLAALWSRFLEAAVLNPHVLSYLAQEHHTLRVRRFSEAYFFTEHPKETSLTFQEEPINRQGQIAAEVRCSDYLAKMPPLPVECLDIDGDWNSLPIIFEDRYVEFSQSEWLPHVPVHATSDDHTDPGAILAANRTHLSSLRAKCFEVSQDPSDSDDCMDLTTYVSLIGKQRKTNCKHSHDSIPMEEGIERQVGDPQESNDVSLVEESSSSGLGKSAEPDSCRTEEIINHGNAHLVPEDRANHYDASKDSISQKSEDNESDNSMPINHFMAGQSEDAPVSNPAVSAHSISSFSPGGLRKEKRHRGGPAISKIIKRSSSVISDSGIESEPSSVAWPVEAALRGRPPLDFSSEREIPQQKVFLHPVLRSSLEGLQMESNGSLPSGGIQASLTSISSLPYEDEREQSHSGKLTKSMSAPQISSPDDNEEDCAPPIQEVQAPNGLTRHQHSDQMPFSLNSEQSESSILDTSSMTNISSEGTVSSEMSNHPQNVLETHESRSLLSCKSVEGPHVKESPVMVSHGENVNQNISGLSVSVKDVHLAGLEALPCSPGHKPSSHKSAMDPQSVINVNECQSLHQTELHNQESRGLLLQLDSSGYSQDRDLTRLTTDEPSSRADRNGTSAGGNETAEDQAKLTKEPNSGLAFVNKKMVEVVNMSVSCAPTCLPFSSVLRDSPSMSGMSTRQTTSPITNQPLGSFGIISSTLANHLGMDHETNERMLSFFKAKEELLTGMSFHGGLYSDLPLLASDLPYFPPEEDDEEFDDGIHLVVCVHGLDGNSADLRLVKTFIELGLPGSRLDFLMSERNQIDTFADFDTMTDRLLDEIIQHIQLYNLTIGRISFIGHSLGNVIIRSVLTRPRFRCYLPRLHTFLSLSGPHLGTLYNNSTLVSTGLWLMQKLKKSGSLLQLTFRDHTDPRKTFLYLLSQKPGLHFFKNVVLVASPQDRYVPFHSARIEMCKTALKDKTTGPVYTEMINNLLQPLVEAKDCRLIRQNVFHALPNTANTLIGRAAHIAVLDSELFLEKFFLVAGLDYFK
ncbi:protein FAM135B isoform X2 [Syngnathoides biaculeatus]|uniref:protein FAM135B isoform X2 n=1 Tax=Syngnathoides biaculeatus TaxID=300417 RepID=UPI002ADE536B|nr:protein FAM135B isoform X2 [Syngnathoides biaculeatus]